MRKPRKTAETRAELVRTVAAICAAGASLTLLAIKLL